MQLTTHTFHLAYRRTMFVRHAVRGFTVLSLSLSSALAAPQQNYAPSISRSIPMAAPAAIGSDAGRYRVTLFPTVTGIGTRDVAPDPDGSVWFAAQWSGALGHLNPRTGELRIYPLGPGSHPHGVVMGPEGDLWICDESNTIRRFNRRTKVITNYQLKPFPISLGYGNLNTPTFDRSGILWFTAQNGFYASLDPKTGAIQVYPAPGGFGPYGITTTPAGEVWYTNLAASHIARINTSTAKVDAVVPIPDSNAQGSRRIWSDSAGNLWVTTWGNGTLFRYSPSTQRWIAYKLPGLGPRGYSTYVDDNDKVWMSDFGTNSILMFDPKQESFTIFPGNRGNIQALQMAGIGPRVWAGMQGVDQLALYERLP